MTNLISRFAKDESGATAIEYALIAAIVGIGLIAVLNLLGTNISNAFGRINTGLTNAGTTTTTPPAGGS